jgi:hypothetical protein
VRFSIRSLLLMIFVAAVGASGARWWLRVSEERRYLSEFDPTRDQIVNWPEDRQAIARPVLDDLLAELMDAAYFASKQRKLAICNRYIDLLSQSHHKSYRADVGRAFADLGEILRFPDADTKRLAARLGFDVEGDRRAMREWIRWQEDWRNKREPTRMSR